MDPLQIDEFRQRLVGMREDSLRQLADLRGGPVGRAEASAAHFAGAEASRAELETAKALEFTLDERETAELRGIEAALARIAEGTYGRCVDCGTNIPLPRLRAAPQAERCIACQDSFERRHGAPRSGGA